MPNPPGPDIAAHWLVDCIDARGNPIKVGVGTTRSGRIIPLCPSGHVPILNAQQATELVDAIRRAIQDAASRAR